MGLILYLASVENRKAIKKLEKTVDIIENLESKYQVMTDEELKAQTNILKGRLNDNYETLDDILPDAFALVREAGKRVLSMRHFRVQLMGGIILHQGRIAQMGTGEGKTLVSTLPAFLNALAGKGVHVVTVNDYLAKRDAEWMGKIHRFLGLTVGVVTPDMNHEAKVSAYNCDITYATNSELGFDYLRDNMVLYKEQKSQRELYYAVIDEVDSILIDEARTPLIISGKGKKSSEMYTTAHQFARRLKASTNVDDEGKLLEGEEEYNGDFDVDLKKKAITLTEKGIEKAEYHFGIDDLSDYEHNELNHYINNALKANFVFKREDNYVVQDGEVIIVDEFTGRLMIGRRYSDGLHQAIEAKEGVRIQNENRTIATITFQNYFRLYNKLGGMTGTAKTEEEEFKGIYGLDVVIVPPNVPSRRIDENDKVYKTKDGKWRAVIEEIKECNSRGQPVLVGTTTVEISEEVFLMLKKSGFSMHNVNVLNAKNHEREAEFVAQAGKKGMVTIATNMAGRGTDILLGGNAEYMAKKRMRDLGMSEEAIYNSTAFFNTDDQEILQARADFKKFFDEYKVQTDKEKEEVMACGGLRIIGTERHESRRIDDQLRGRAGRQGDLGSSLFFLSMEDDVLRLFGGPAMQRISNIFRIDEDTPFEMGMLTRRIRSAQKSLEARNYSIRKHVLEYDDVNNVQRTIIYKERNRVLNGESVHEQIVRIMDDKCASIVKAHTNPKVDYQEWDCEGLNAEIHKVLMPNEPEFFTKEKFIEMHIDELIEDLQNELKKIYAEKIREAASRGIDFEEPERVIMLKVIDNKWMDHIDSMEVLKREIHLKGYGNYNPVTAFKQEGFEMFDNMIARIHEDLVMLLLRVNVEQVPIKRQAQAEVTGAKLADSKERTKQLREASKAGQSQVISEPKIGRNDPCPCGSGKKYKACCDTL